MQLSNGRWGYIDARGRMQVNAVYDKAEPMRDGFALVAGFPRFEGGQLLERGFQALVARSGGELTRIYNDDAESAFDELGEFSSGFAPVRKGANWGFIDREGKAAVPLKFERVRPFAGRFGAAKLNGQWGFVDKFGKFSRMPALPAPHLRTFDGGAQFSLDGTHWGIVRAPDGEIISNPKWADLLPYSDRRAVYRTGQALGAIDDLGETAVNPIYHALGPFTESLGRYQLEPHGPFGFVDRRGKIAIEGQFDEVLPFSNGLAAARIGDRWGYIDRNGDPQLAFRYSEATPFEEGVAFVRE
ncbi:MAG: WG repeat-containing protein [Verrucomicrobiales bacterium]